MYSYKDRIRAVELYIKLGKRVRATICQLGYPTKNALKGWHREYERGLDLPLGCAVRVPQHTRAQEEVAVEHYLATHQRSERNWSASSNLCGATSGNCSSSVISRRRPMNS
jgi:transposase-like protein